MPATTLSLASFFTIEAREYTNFTFDADARATVRNIILAFCVGILIASLYALYQKQIPGAIVRAILRAEALSPESARTAEELGLCKNPLIRFELKHNTTLKGLVHTVEAGENEGENAESSAPVRYYIPEELKYRAEVRYDTAGSGLFSIILTIVLTLIIGVVLIRFLPAMLGVIDRLMN